MPPLITPRRHKRAAYSQLCRCSSLRRCSLRSLLTNCVQVYDALERRMGLLRRPAVAAALRPEMDQLAAMLKQFVDAVGREVVEARNGGGRAAPTGDAASSAPGRNLSRQVATLAWAAQTEARRPNPPRASPLLCQAPAQPSPACSAPLAAVLRSCGAHSRRRGVSAQRMRYPPRLHQPQLSAAFLLSRLPFCFHLLFGRWSLLLSLGPSPCRWVLHCCRGASCVAHSQVRLTRTRDALSALGGGGGAEAGTEASELLRELRQFTAATAEAWQADVAKRLRTIALEKSARLLDMEAESGAFSCSFNDELVALQRQARSPRRSLRPQLSFQTDGACGAAAFVALQRLWRCSALHFALP